MAQQDNTTEIYQNSSSCDYGQYDRQAIEQYSNILLREAEIANPTLEKYRIGSGAGNSSVQPNNDELNVTTMMCSLAWTDRDGGIMNEHGGGARNTTHTYPSSPELKSAKNDTNQKPMVPITSPLCWFNGDNWMGIRWLPPTGAKCIVGFGKDFRTYILGWFQPDQKSAKPVIEPGEMILKGFKNNYIHLRQGNKIDIVAKAPKNEQDLDDCYCAKSAKDSSACYISMNADSGYIDFMVNGTLLHMDSDGISMSASGNSSITLNKDGDASVFASNAINKTSAVNNDNTAKDVKNG